MYILRLVCLNCQVRKLMVSSLMVSSQEGQAMVTYKRIFKKGVFLFVVILAMLLYWKRCKMLSCLAKIHLWVEVGGEAVVAECVPTGGKAGQNCKSGFKDILALVGGRVPQTDQGLTLKFWQSGVLPWYYTAGAFDISCIINSLFLGFGSVPDSNLNSKTNNSYNLRTLPAICFFLAALAALYLLPTLMKKRV